MNDTDRIEIINQWKLGKIFEQLECGNMRIPRFQRAYVWERSKIVKLLSSIYSQYPIGSFFIWETGREMESFCRDISDFGFPKKPEGDKFLFILDGQQRITSLYVALKGKVLNGVDYRSICFNLDRKVFKIPTLKTEPNNIPVYKIYDSSLCMQLAVEYTAKGRQDLGAKLMRCNQILTTYPVSVVKSSDMGLDEVVTIFERINQGGKRLSLFDLVHASVWSSDFDLREEISKFNAEKAVSIFGKLWPEVFVQSLALNVTGDCVKAHQLSLKNAECKAVWGETLECIRLAIDHMKRNYGVQSLSIIPYQNVIPLIQYYFFRSKAKGVRPEHKGLLADWFWSLTFSSRYSSSTLTKMTADAKWISDLVDGKTSPRVFTVKLNAEDLRKTLMKNASVVKNGVLCLMALNSPADFDNGDPVTIDKTNCSRSNSKENHHFFPFSLRGAFALTQNDVNSVLNFAFISKRLNLDILNRKPSVYLAAYRAANPNFEADLLSHFIDEEALEAALRDDFRAFIERRGSLILSRINEVCRVNDNIGTVSANLSEEELDDDDANENEEGEKAREPISWLIPANGKYFDLEGCLNRYGRVYWKSANKYEEGDTIYIYCSLPDQAVRYKLVVEDGHVSDPEEYNEGSKFYVGNNADDVSDAASEHALFRLVRKSSDKGLDLAELTVHGLAAPPRGAMYLSGELLDYVESFFTKD